MQRFLFLCLLALCATTPLTSETFLNPRRLPTIGDPQSLIVADFNGDGLPDIAYIDSSAPAGIPHVLLAQPGGTYVPAPAISTSTKLNGNCRALDTNKDNKQDLVCTYSSTFNATLVTLPGNGDGTFGTPILTAMPASNGSYFYPNIYPPMDLNSDGVPDLIVNEGNDSRSLIMLGDGNGGFRYASTIYVTKNVMAADINHDGKTDLLLINGPTVMIGRGDGTFDNPRLYSLDFDYDNICTFADVDKDGQLDAVCGYVETITGDIDGATHLIVLHGNADGSFDKTPVYDKVFGHHDTQYDGEGTFQYPVLVTDVNADGIPDILAFAGDGYSVLLGQAGPDFTYPKHYDAGSYNYSVFGDQLFIDVDKDGLVDIVSPGTNGIYISYGRRDGSFATASAYEVAETLGHATFADFNGDNIPDVAATGGTAVQISLGKGDGTFSTSSRIENSGINFSTPLSPDNAYIMHGDFNGDGKQDLLAIGSSSIYQYDSYLYFGNGDGTFQPIQKVSNTSTMVPQFSTTKVADIDRDGRDDILSSDVISSVAPEHANIYVSLSNGDGTFRTVTTQMPGEPYNGVFYAANCPPDLADFDHDGKLDAVFGAYSNAYVLKGRGDGSFDPNPLTLPIPGGNGGTAGVAAADFDGDGNQDFALLYHGSSYVADTVVFIYYGNGDGTFSTPLSYPITFHAYSLITTSDLNGDGLPDIILRGIGIPYDHWSISVIHAKPGRALDSEVNYIAGSGLQDMAALDVNKDGHPDLLIANNLAGSVTVLLNQSVPTVTGVLTASPEPSFVQQPFTLTASLYPPPPPSSATISGTVSFFLDGASLGSSPVTSNAATFNISSQVARGAHTLTAIWSGDNNYPSISLNGTHTVTGYPVALPFTSSANPVVFGQPFSLQYSLSNAATVPSGIPQPSGTFSLTNDGSNLFPATNVTGGLSGSAAFTLGLAPAGRHTLVASYSGDDIHEPASANIIENVTPISSTIVAQTSPNPSVYGKPITVSATLTIPTGNSLGRLLPPPQPTITFTGFPGGPVTTLALFNLNQSTSASTVLTASYTANSVPAGTYNITAAYSGNANSQASVSSPVTHIVQPAPTTTALTASATSAYQHQPVTLSARITGALATPTGSVQLLDGTIPLTTLTLASGSATFATSQLGVGIHTLTAVYSGDANNLTSTSSAITVTILPSDFKLSLDPPSISLVTGHHTSLHLTATSLGIFADTVHLSASNLPQWTTVQFTPADIKLTAGSTATTSVYVDTDAVIGYLSQASPRLSRTPGIPAAAAAIALILAPITLRRRRRLASLLALTIVAALLAAASGCSGKYPDSTPPGVYTLQITATGAQTGLTHTINLPLTVTQ